MDTIVGKRGMDLISQSNSFRLGSGKGINEIYKIPLSDGFYLNDIIGFKVINDVNLEYGYLKDILVLTGNEVLVIDCNGKEVLLPNVEEFVKLFDFDKKVIVVSNVEQFFE